ncbi:MAG: polysaccharide biosynthesis tyrosine autokinase [Acidobacteria bacterium]|nr:polysaccharide biosynthesis tyrosine autokinase [Acidobacteriota bacterium]
MANDPRIMPAQFALEPEPNEGEFHISQWIEVVRRRRRLLALVAATVLLVSAVLYAITPRMYRASTIIQIERRSASAVVSQQSIQYDDWLDAQSFLPTQLRLLRSRGLAERVVRNLRLGEDPAFNPGRANLLGSAGMTSSAADDAAAQAGLAGRVQAGLGVAPVEETRLVEISFVSPAPELAARVANGIADAFIDWGVETRFATVGKASSFLTSQIETVKQEIQDKEAQLQAYGRQTDIVTLDPASNVILQRLEALNRDYIAAVSERIAKEARHNEIANATPDVVASAFPGSLVGQLQADQTKLERDYANKLATYKPEWPAMQELKAQIDKNRLAVLEAVGKARDSARSDYQTALRREQSLTAELTRQKADAMQLNSAAVEYNNLKVEVSTRRKLLDDLISRQSQTEVESRLQGTRDSNVMVVDRALVPGGPYRPSLRRNLSLGLLLGLGLGLGMVFFVEYLDRTLKTPDDVDRVLGLPILAVIPDVSRPGDRYGYGHAYYGYGRRQRNPPKPKKALSLTRQEVPIELLPHGSPRLAVSESYRGLRTALLLSTANGLKTVVVTSAIPGEGKTATAANLAVVLAQLGRDVLLVDADLRKSRLHEVFNLSNRVGLVNFLTGGADPAAVFLRTAIPSLYLTPSGPTPPNPAELLSSERMREYLELARQRFDYVVFDSPPALPVTDSTLLGSMADGVVLCVGAGTVLREDARSCLERLRLSEVRVLGVALNRFRIAGGRYGKQYRSYEAYVDSSTGDPSA